MKLFSTIRTLAILAALAFGAYAALAWAGGALAQLATPSALAALAALLAAWLVTRGVRRARLRRAAEHLHAEQAATYQFFADVWAAVVTGTGEDLAGERRALDRLMTLYAGADPLRAHLALRALERERGAGDPAVRLKLAQGLLAIRRDLGVETRGLAVEQLQALFDAEPRGTSALSTEAPPAPAFKDFRPHVSLRPDV